MTQLKELKKVVKNHKVEWFYDGHKVINLKRVLEYLFNLDFEIISNTGEYIMFLQGTDVPVLTNSWLEMLFKIEGSKEPISVQDVNEFRCIIFELETCISEKDSESVIMIDRETLEIHV